MAEMSSFFLFLPEANMQRILYRSLSSSHLTYSLLLLSFLSCREGSGSEADEAVRRNQQRREYSLFRCQRTARVEAPSFPLQTKTNQWWQCLPLWGIPLLLFHKTKDPLLCSPIARVLHKSCGCGDVISFVRRQCHKGVTPMLFDNRHLASTRVHIRFYGKTTLKH